MNYIEIEQEMTKTYNAIATKYEKEAEDDWKDKRYVDMFLEQLNNNASILDIGCGTGILLKYYTDKGFRATGLDIAKEMVSISKRKVPDANVIEKSMYDIDKLEEKFDGVVATFIFVHIPKEKINEVINKVNGRLNRNGVFFMVFTTSLQEGVQQEPLDNNYKYYAVNYSKEEVENILTNNGFEILESIETARINKSDVAMILAKKV